jgi:hypothetical protein
MVEESLGDEVVDYKESFQLTVSSLQFKKKAVTSFQLQLAMKSFTITHLQTHRCRLIIFYWQL